MRFFSSVFYGLLLIPAAIAAKAPAKDRFETYHQKSLSSTPLKLRDSTYNTLTKAPRDYSVAVLLTALEPRFGCQLCREFQPEWDLLSKSWIKGDKKAESRLLFGTLDFMDGKDIFQSLGLSTAPVLLFFPATAGPHAVLDGAPIRYDFTSGPQTAEQAHTWLSKNLDGRPHPLVKRPINWMRIFAVTITVLGSITFLSVSWPYLLPILQNRNLWAAISLIAILLFTSGHMFNHIRKVPYIAGDGKGGVSYFANGFQNQYGLETQVIAAMYGVLSFATISLALKVPRIADPKMQQVAVIVWGGIIFAMYSFLLSVFRIKNGGYPFWLPPFV